MSYKVIVADDSPSVQKAVELALSTPEFETIPFTNGLDAIAALPGLLPDAVLVGLSLPAKDGYEVAGFVRSQEGGRQTALFFLRGAFEPLDLQKIAQVEYDGIVLQPFDGEMLAGLVRDTIDRKKELPSLPEEPVLEKAVLLDRQDEISAAPAVPGWTDEMGKKIQEIVREEIRAGRDELEAVAREIVSAEFKKLLVEELKGIDTRKI